MGCQIRDLWTRLLCLIRQRRTPGHISVKAAMAVMKEHTLHVGSFDLEFYEPISKNGHRWLQTLVKHRSQWPQVFMFSSNRLYIEHLVWWMCESMRKMCVVVFVHAACATHYHLWRCINAACHTVSHRANSATTTLCRWLSCIRVWIITKRPSLTTGICCFDVNM